ncbi:iron(III) transport system ATP-binding protein [Marinobacterium halophilum]|uniref:Iron(III) transport system ATP-binding protein n=1 Tax=Marinobacterium halophilum TaxID=267374 RepID=A0A2P8F4M8_9GAMM|nr:ABC transporter ATP-binding protein [Marinobacterium halophilum]PSL16653.1 iron(III) transport system ATP-binding protein [Marinobacterium halophilum]
MAALLSIEGLKCAYQSQLVLDDVALSIEQGEIACLLGPSGCGKTTVLRAIAGFIAPLAGTIRLGEQIISSHEQVVPPEKRGMGMVFQDYALFPHLSIADNIAFGLGNLSRADKRKRIQDVLDLVELPDLSDRYPHELSGGQQQRVALARALAPDPRLLLMDEPFSNLDTDLRRQLSQEVRDILKQRGIAAIMVTHDQQEAFTISDKIGILSAGRVQQWGAPEELYYHPATPEVAAFVGKGELFNGCVTEEMAVDTELGLLDFAEPLGVEAGGKVQLFLRPGDLYLSHEGGMQGEILGSEFQGSLTLYRIRLSSGREVEVLEQGLCRYPEGEPVRVHVTAHRPIVFSDTVSARHA